MSRRIAIVGAGLAGIAAAIRLAEFGHKPILIETRRKFGGRATSFDDSRSGLTIDNCQHVLLGCCTNLIDLYDRLGVLDMIEWHDTLFWTAGRGEIDRIRAGWLPAPLHLSRSFSKMGLLSRTEKRQIRSAMWRMIRLGSTGRQQWRGRTFAEFLGDSGQDESTIRRFWNTIIVSACNLSADRVCAATAMHVFQDGFLAHRFAYSMGLSIAPLSALYAPAEPIIDEAGGEVHLGVSAKAIAYDGKRVTGVITDEGVIESAAVIAAVPFDRLEKLTSEIMRAADARLQRLDQFEVSPILGVHVWFDQPIMSLPHLVLVDCHVQWLFNKGVDPEGRQHLHAVISAADEWMELDESEIVSRVLRDICKALPNAIGLSPVVSRAVKEKRATFAATPAAELLRPPTAPGYVGLGGGGIENLIIAGDWTDTGWPATMEGAVRSGYAAAGSIADTTCVIDDLPRSVLARLLGLR